MKKTVFMLLGCAAIMTACNQNQTTSTSDVEPAEICTETDTLMFKGEGPAADGTYEYTLQLYGDTIKEASLVEIGNTPQGKDTIAMTTGIVNVISKDGKTYYRVNENKVDSLTFLQVDENTLRLVNDEFQEPTEKALYTELKLQK